MKRILSAFLAVALILALLPSALAASDEAAAAASALYELGLFNGTGTDETGNPVFELDRAPTRHEAITMLVRLLGKATEAENGTWATPFTDVAEWAKPYVGYAYTNGLAGGTSATTFNGNENITASQYITFVLRTLGYESGTDFQWDRAWELSDKIGLTDGRYNAETTNFTRGDVAIISYRSLSIPKKNQTDSSNPDSDTPVSSNSITKQLFSGEWLGQNSTDDAVFMESYRFTDSGYTCAFRAFDAASQELMLSGYEEGTYNIHDNTLEISSTKRYQLIAGSGQTQVSNESNTSSYQITFDDASYTTLHMDDWFYMKMDDDMISKFPLHEAIKSEIMEHMVPETSVNGYSYLVESDFRNIRRRYSQAVAQCGYALAYTDLNGDSCVLTTVQYKIIRNYSVTILHNLTQNRTIEDPADYYNAQASRAYGGSKTRYWNLSNEVLTHYQEMLKAMVSVLETGVNTGGGVFVDAATLNQ